MKSHFRFTIKQRNGIFLLLILIVVIQGVYVYVDFSSKNIIVDVKALQLYKSEIESLKQVEIENRKPKTFPFNPNFITDHKGYTLGMSNQEINRLLKFRKQDQWVSSAKQFQQITKVSDSLLARMSPYFKFPKWVTNTKSKQRFVTKVFNNKSKSEDEKIDLNTATVEQLQKVFGVGKILSERILKYRIKQNGFAAIIELQEVYGLSLETIIEIKKHFSLKTPRVIKKINLNKATKAQLVTIQYIDYEIAYNIIEERTLRESFNTFDELTKVKGFPVNKFDIIRLYLTLN